MFCYLTIYIIIWRFWTDFTRISAKPTIGKSSTATLLVPTGSYLDCNKLFFNETFLYFIVTFELCPSNQTVSLFVLSLEMSSYMLLFCTSVVCCSVMSRFYTSFCNNICTNAFCFSCKTAFT